MSNPAHANAQDALDDLLVIERNDPPRALVGMKGRYQLEGWRDAEGNVRQFECAILKITPNTINLSAPVTGAIGNWIVTHFEHFGKLEGPIIQIQQRALVMKIFGTIADRAKVASKIAWIMDAGKPQARQHFRMVPVTPESIVSLPGEPALPCEVIDYSVGGAAIYADASPEVGSVVKLGKVLSRVVRLFGGGFAVSFMAVQNPQVVEEAIFQPATPVNQNDPR
jgi:hypothetical protein